MLPEPWKSWKRRWWYRMLWYIDKAASPFKFERLHCLGLQVARHDLIGVRTNTARAPFDEGLLCYLLYEVYRLLTKTDPGISRSEIRELRNCLCYTAASSIMIIVCLLLNSVVFMTGKDEARFDWCR